MVGRRIPGGQNTLKLLGLDNALDNLARRLEPILESLRSMFGRATGGTEPRPTQQRQETRPYEERQPLRRPEVPRQRDVEIPDVLPGNERDLRRQRFLDEFGSQRQAKTRELPTPVLSWTAGNAGGQPKELSQTASSIKGSPALANPSVSATPGAAAGGGALAGVAAVAGPLAIAELANQIKGAIADALSGAIRFVGTEMAHLVRTNDVGGALRRLGGSIIETADKIPLVGKSLTFLPKIFMAVADAATELKNAFLERARELSKYSGPIAVEQALANVRRIQVDIKEAQTLGPKMAKLVEAQSKIDTALAEFMIPVKEALLNVVVPIIQRFANFAQSAAAVGSFVGNKIDETNALVRAISSGDWFLLPIIADRLRTISVNTEPKRDEPSEGWNDLLGAYTSIDTATDLDAGNNPEGLPRHPNPL